MAVIVTGIMNGIDLDEAGKSDNEQAKKRDKAKLDETGLRFRLRLLDCLRSCIHGVFLSPPPEGLVVSPVTGRSPGSRYKPVPPSQRSVSSGIWNRIDRTQLRGQPRLRARALDRIPSCSPSGTGNVAIIVEFPSEAIRFSIALTRLLRAA